MRRLSVRSAVHSEECCSATRAMQRDGEGSALVGATSAALASPNVRFGWKADADRNLNLHFIKECSLADLAGVAVAWDGAPLMRFLKSLRATEVAEDPHVVARLNQIAARSKAEASLYQAIQKARRSQGAVGPVR